MPRYGCTACGRACSGGAREGDPGWSHGRAGSGGHANTGQAGTSEEEAGGRRRWYGTGSETGTGYAEMGGEAVVVREKVREPGGVPGLASGAGSAAVTGYARRGGTPDAPGETVTVRAEVRESGRLPGLARCAGSAAVARYAGMGGASDAPRTAGTVREEVRESGDLPRLVCTGAQACTVYGKAVRLG